MREFEIERQFQIKIDIIKANKGIYYIKTNKGERCLKKNQLWATKTFVCLWCKRTSNKKWI